MQSASTAKSKMSLRKEILELEKLLKSKKEKLFLDRLLAITGPKANISDININTQLDNTWCISYIHKTTFLNPADYEPANMYTDEATNLEANLEAKNSESTEQNNVLLAAENTSEYETKISFGKNKKYFITGGCKLNVYRNSANELRITNPEYEYDLDIDEQKELMIRYSNNKNLPVWFAIKFLLYMSDNSWDDDSVVNHFTVI